MVKQKEQMKDHSLTFTCLFCKQQISLNLIDTSKPQFKNHVTQLNVNPAQMLKSTVRNLEFKEKQMLARNKQLIQKNTFLENLLKQVIRTNKIDLNQLPKDLLEQDKFNFIRELRQSLGPRQSKGEPYERPMELTNPKKSKSEPQLGNFGARAIKHTPMISEGYDKQGLKPGSRTAKHPMPSGVGMQPSSSYYGFEVRQMKAPQSNNVRSSAKELEERLQRMGQNKFIRPQL